MSRLFGTDGLRGQVNTFPMLPELALRLGLAVGEYFRSNNKHNRVVIGKDTRLSGYIFEAALTAGFAAAGMTVYQVGPLPTPAISFITKNMRADVGVVISASHNPYFDNGIKFFDSNGFKLADEVEDILAEMILSPDKHWNAASPKYTGRVSKIEDSPGRYIVALKNTFPTQYTLDGLRIVLDCSNGAAYRVSPLMLEELGAEVIKIGCNPNGLNINDGVGSLFPDQVAKKVLETRADIGLALDGDADRLIVVDEKGNILDGDKILAICAKSMLKSNNLPKNTLVATVMSNIALDIFMRENNGNLIRTKVGDRYVVEAMRNGGYMLGGEQSGHLVFMEHATTGDGTLAALQILKIMIEQQKHLSEIADFFEPFPQTLINIKVNNRKPFEDLPDVQKYIKEINGVLKDKGRILLRYSGTEPLARVMVEGENAEFVHSAAEKLAELLIKNLS